MKKFKDLNVMKKFKDLTPEEQAEIVEYLVKHGYLEVRSSVNVIWATSNSIYPEFIYRIPVTKPSINWDEVHPDYNWLDKNSSGQGRLYKWKPSMVSWEPSPPCVPTTAFKSYDPGTCKPEDSLVARPGVEQ